MKLVDISEFYSESGGGVKTYVHQKFAWCAANGREFTLIAPGAEDRVEPREGGKIIWVKCKPIPVDKRYFLFGDPAPVHDILAAEKPDVLEASSPWQGGRIASYWPGKAVKSFFVHADPVASYPETFIEPFIGEALTRWGTKWFWRYLKRLTDACDTTVVGSHHMGRRYREFGLREPEVIPLGLDKSRFSPALRDEALRTEMLAQCGLPEDAKLMIAVSRFHPEKRVPQMIRAIAKANEIRSVGFVVVGDGLARKGVERAAAKVPQVRLAGSISDKSLLPRMVASADGFFHGCSSETFCIVAGEAMVSGTPLVVPNRGGASDMGQSGFAETWKAGNVKQGADAVLRLLSRERKLMSQLAYRHSQSALNTPDDHFSDLFAHYEKLVAGRRS